MAPGWTLGMHNTCRQLLLQCRQLDGAACWTATVACGGCKPDLSILQCYSNRPRPLYLTQDPPAQMTHVLAPDHPGMRSRWFSHNVACKAGGGPAQSVFCPTHFLFLVVM